MSFDLDPRSREHLLGVHPDLVKVINAAAASDDMSRSGVSFIVTEGLRSASKQQVYFAHGASSTLNSRHLDGHAVDVAMLIAGQVTWNWQPYYHMAAVMKAAAEKLGIPLVWGGDWKPPTVHDGCHFELPWDKYPSQVQQTGQTAA